MKLSGTPGIDRIHIELSDTKKYGTDLNRTVPLRARHFCFFFFITIWVNIRLAPFLIGVSDLRRIVYDRSVPGFRNFSVALIKMYIELSNTKKAHEDSSGTGNFFI